MRSRIVDYIVAHLREHGQPPSSVAQVCEALGIGEAEFHEHFPSLEAAESVFWTDLVGRVIRAVESGVEWEEFNARQRLLAFYFAFTEESQQHRAVLNARLGERGAALLRPDFLEGFEARFREFAERIIARGVATEEIADRGALAALFPGGLYVQFRSIIGYHLGDESEGCERTDAFIEKSVTLAFELLRKQAFDAAFDLLRFLLPNVTDLFNAPKSPEPPATDH